MFKAHGSRDPSIEEVWRCWLSKRDSIAKSLVKVQAQRSYYQHQKSIKGVEKVARHKKRKSEISGIKFSNIEHSGAEALLEELEMMRTAENGKMVGRDWKKEKIIQGRVPTKAPLRFECHMLNDRLGRYSSQKSSFLADTDNSSLISLICPDIENQLPKTNTTIFVDNLPIDI